MSDPIYTVRGCSYSCMDGATPKLTLVIAQTIDGKEWLRNVSLSGDAATALWDQYTAATEQATIASLLAV